MFCRMFWSERKLAKARDWFMKTVKLDPDFGDAWAYFFRFDHPLNVIHTFTLYITKYWFWVLSDFFRLFSQPQLPIRQETHPGCSHFFLM